MDAPRLNLEPIDPEPWLAPLRARFGFRAALFDGYAFYRPNVKSVAIAAAGFAPPVGAASIGLPFLRTNMTFPKLTTGATRQFGASASIHRIELDADQLDAYYARDCFDLRRDQLGACDSLGYAVALFEGIALGLGMYRPEREAMAPRLDSLFPEGAREPRRAARDRARGGAVRFPRIEQTARYLPEADLGEGALGSSFLVEDTERGRRVVFGTIDRHRPHDLDQFERDFAALGRLHHPNLVPFLDLIRGEDLLGYTRAFVDGRDLRASVRELIEEPEREGDEISQILGHAERAGDERRAPLRDRLERLAGALPGLIAGLEHLHRFKHVHGALHPGCVLIERAGGAGVLADYGLVELIDADPEEASEPLSAGAVRARWRRRRVLLYRAPELFRAGGRDARGRRLLARVHSVRARDRRAAVSIPRSGASSRRGTATRSRRACSIASRTARRRGRA